VKHEHDVPSVNIITFSQKLAVTCKIICEKFYLVSDCQTHSQMGGGGDNIRRDFKGIGWVGVDWIYLAEDGYACLAAVNTVSVQVPLNVRNF
jgi:hypothetical protein